MYYLGVVISTIIVIYFLVFHFRFSMCLLFLCASCFVFTESNSLNDFGYYMIQLIIVSVIGMVFSMMAIAQYNSEVEHYNYLVDINRNAGVGTIMLARLLRAEVVYEPDPIKIYGLWAVGWFVVSIITLIVMN